MMRSRLFPYSLKEALFNENNICEVCKDPIHRIENSRVDHIIPWSKGGMTVEDNAQLLCINCNLTKSNKIMMTSDEIVERLTSNSVMWQNCLNLIVNYYSEEPQIIGKICFDLYKSCNSPIIDNCHEYDDFFGDGVEVETYIIQPYMFLVAKDINSNHILINVEGITVENKTGNIGDWILIKTEV